jgi:hypothetical protein
VIDFNWDDCVSKLSVEKIDELAAERGVSEATIDGLHQRGLIGACYVPKWERDCVCFPIYGKDGDVFRAHCRSPQRNAAGKWKWAYEPDKDPERPRPIPALVFGNPETASKRLVFESQWDAISAIDKLGLLPQIDSGQICLMMTRGADGTGRLKEFNWPSGIAICAFPQNDDPGRKWLANVIDITGGAYVVGTPSAYKDLGEWLKESGADAEDIEYAMETATFEKPAAPLPSASVEPPPPAFEQGHSIAWYAEHPINSDDTLLGDRYLCKGGGMFIVAPSGLGKSTLSIQLAVLWCCGLVAFGIKPRKALRILIVQSEDDQGDCTEMSQVMEHLGLTDEQKKRVWQNSELIRCNTLVRKNFIDALRARLQKERDDGKPFDLVMINPYSVYLGADVKDTEACLEFLNEWLNPILSGFNLGAVLIHHTPKTNFQNTDKYNLWDWMYHGAGCAGITNWARAILVIKPESKDLKVYRFIAAKRGQRIGWQDGFERYFAWSTLPGVLRWEDATAEQVAETTSKKGAHKTVDLDKALEQIPLIDPELKTSVILKIQVACGVGEKPAKHALNELIVAEKVVNASIPNPSGHRKFAGVVRSSAATA